MNAADTDTPGTVSDIPVPIVARVDRVSIRLEGADVFDDDVELPKRKGKPPRDLEAPRLPLARIPVGKSYLARGARGSAVTAAVAAYHKRFEGELLVTREFDRDPKYNVAGVRIWRMR